jgi:hypothetical protein
MGLSNAERQARWKAKRAAEIEQLRQQLAAATRQSGKPTEATKQTSPDDAAALAQAKARIAELEKAGTAAAAEIASLKAELHDMLGARFAPRQRPGKPKAEKPPLPPDEERDRIIKGLKTRVRNLTQELRHAEHHYKDAIANSGGMLRETRLAIDKVLHPDARPTEAEKDRAAKGWNVWKGDNDKASRRRAR